MNTFKQLANPPLKEKQLALQYCLIFKIYLRGEKTLKFISNYYSILSISFIQVFPNKLAWLKDEFLKFV